MTFKRLSLLKKILKIWFNLKLELRSFPSDLLAGLIQQLSYREGGADTMMGRQRGEEVTALRLLIKPS